MNSIFRGQVFVIICRLWISMPINIFINTIKEVELGQIKLMQVAYKVLPVVLM